MNEAKAATESTIHTTLLNLALEPERVCADITELHTKRVLENRKEPLYQFLEMTHVHDFD